MTRLMPALLCAALSLGSAGCSQLLSGVAKVAQVAQWMGSVLDSAQAGTNTYFARHPNQAAEQSVDDRMADLRDKIAQLNAAAVGAGPAIDEARGEALKAYQAYLDVIGSTGVRDARAPEGGAEGNGPMPSPLTLPTAADFAARM